VLTRIANQIRDFLAEFGVVIPRGVNTLKAQWLDLRQHYADSVPAIAWAEIDVRIYLQSAVLYRHGCRLTLIGERNELT